MPPAAHICLGPVRELELALLQLAQNDAQKWPQLTVFSMRNIIYDYAQRFDSDRARPSTRNPVPVPASAPVPSAQFQVARSNLRAGRLTAS